MVHAILDYVAMVHAILDYVAMVHAVFIYIYIYILWGGRWHEGAAYSTGENMEQLFSNLSRHNITTKYMYVCFRYTQCDAYTYVRSSVC